MAFVQIYQIWGVTFGVETDPVEPEIMTLERDKFLLDSKSTPERFLLALACFPVALVVALVVSLVPLQDSRIFCAVGVSGQVAQLGEQNGHFGVYRADFVLMAKSPIS